MHPLIRSVIRRNGTLRKIALRFWDGNIVTIDGARYCLHARNNRTERYAFFEGQFPEPQSIAKLSQLAARAPCRFIDIGANCGAFTVSVARAAAVGSTVIAVEPNPVMSARLSENLSLNGLDNDVTVLGVAVSDAPGNCDLHLHAGNLGKSSVLDSTVTGNKGGTISVPMTTLPDLLDGTDKDLPLIIKIDIEGLEDKALWPLLGDDTPHLQPAALLIETIHTENWQHDVLGRLATLGYTATFEGEGNTLFQRQALGALQ